MRRLNYTPSNTAVICEKHFTIEDYEVNVHGNRVLKKGAVPSIFDFPSHLKKEIKKRRVLKRHIKTGSPIKLGETSGIIPMYLLIIYYVF